MARAIQIAAGGACGLTAIMLTLGAVIARLTTSTRQSAVVVVTGVTITGALVGGFMVAPYLSRLAEIRYGARNQDDGSSSSPVNSPRAAPPYRRGETVSDSDSQTSAEDAKDSDSRYL